MPTVLARCQVHGDGEFWRSIHDAAVADCPECGKARVQVMTPPRISVYATPNKGAEARAVDARENRWHKDLPAYKRLRHEGLQPRTTDGCHVLEQEAHDRMEIEMGHLIPKDKRGLAHETRAELRENQPSASSDLGVYRRGEGKPRKVTP